MSVVKMPQCKACGRPINVDRSKALKISACKDWPWCACAVAQGMRPKIEPIKGE